MFVVDRKQFSEITCSRTQTCWSCFTYWNHAL